MQSLAFSRSNCYLRSAEQTHASARVTAEPLMLHSSVLRIVQGFQLTFILISICDISVCVKRQKPIWDSNGRRTSVTTAMWVQALAIWEDRKIIPDFCGACDSSQGILLWYSMEPFPFPILKPFTRRTKPYGYKSLLHFSWGLKEDEGQAGSPTFPQQKTFLVSRWRVNEGEGMAIPEREARGCQSSFHLLLQPLWWNHIFPEWVLGR